MLIVPIFYHIHSRSGAKSQPLVVVYRSEIVQKFICAWALHDPAGGGAYGASPNLLAGGEGARRSTPPRPFETRTSAHHLPSPGKNPAGAHAPGSVNEYQLRLGRQRQVWLIPIEDERVGVQVKL